MRCWGGPLDGQAVPVRYEWQHTIAVCAEGSDWRLRCLAVGAEPGAGVEGLYVLEALPPIGVGPRFCWRPVAVTGEVAGDAHRGGDAEA